MRISKGRIVAVLLGFFCSLHSLCPAGEDGASRKSFVQVSPRDQRYFELSDGRPYIPIGLNMIAPPGRDLDGMVRWIEKLAAGGGNFIRIWLGSPFFDVEHSRSGVYDERKAERIDRLLEICEKSGVRVKMCIESFRHFGTWRQSWSAKPIHLAENGGPARDIADFFDGERSRKQFRRKLAWFKDRYGSHPAIFGWELWNEVDCVAGGDYMAWSEAMLAELHRLFPENLCMQSLGSFDTAGKRERYRRLGRMKGNDVAQVHRYLDLGARLDVCKGPMDVLAADAVRELRAFRPGRPILLAETGAVEPGHTGPFKLYGKDRAGIILHDTLFAPFFAGAAGPGHSWHWDRYVDGNDLWFHYGRFARFVEGIDPAAEAFEPDLIDHPRLRIYLLRGKRTVLVWCRDKENDWRSELRDGKKPETVTGIALEMKKLAPGAEIEQIRAYDPWSDRWSEMKSIKKALRLPPFSRSILLRIEIPR